jgi:hypothetical protein
LYLQRFALTWNPRNFLKAALRAAFKKFLVPLKASIGCIPNKEMAMLFLCLEILLDSKPLDHYDAVRAWCWVRDRERF